MLDSAVESLEIYGGVVEAMVSAASALTEPQLRSVDFPRSVLREVLFTYESGANRPS